MASSRENPSRRTTPLAIALLAAGVAASAGCNPGVGTGELTGTLTAAECELLDAPYSLEPDFFVAEGVLHGLHVRIQRGSDLPVVSDGIWIDVLSSKAIVDLGLGTPLPVAEGSREDAVKVSMYFNETCRVTRHVAPVLLEGIGGTVTFTQIYDPDANGSPNIVGTLDSVELVDPASPLTRHALVSGNFDFLYNRGRPAQRYP